MKRFIFIFLFTIVSTMSGQTARVLSVAGQKILLDLDSKQNAITLTTSGNAGAATLTGATLNVPNYTLAGLGGQTALTGTGLVYSTAGTISYIADNSINWNTAYTDRNKWDGGATGLVATTGRTSLGATTLGANMFTLTNPSAITFPRFNADNTVSALDAVSFRTAIGAGTVTQVNALTLTSSAGSDLTSTVATNATTPTITLNVPNASATQRGALTSTDWTTFNGKQNALTNPVTASTVGTSNYLPKFTAGTTIAKSQIFDDGTSILVGTNTNNTADSGTLFDIRKGSPTVNTMKMFALTSDSGNQKNMLVFNQIGVKGRFEIDSNNEQGVVRDLSLQPNGGIVGIGVNSTTDLDPVYILWVNGKAGGTNPWKSTSDKRLKTNIQPVEDGLNAVMQMKPVTYDKKASLESKDYDIQEIGFIAQELKALFPKGVVDEGADKDKLLSVNYTALIPVLTKAIQEQQKIIETEKATNDKQQKEIDELKAMVKQLMQKK